MYGVQTALHLAVMSKQVAAVHELMRAGADPNLTDRRGLTVCHLAVRHQATHCLPALAHQPLPLPTFPSSSFSAFSSSSSSSEAAASPLDTDLRDHNGSRPINSILLYLNYDQLQQEHLNAFVTIYSINY